MYTQKLVSGSEQRTGNTKRVLAQLTQAFIAYRQAREHRARGRALRSLSDRALKDLGLHRSEIGSVLAESEARMPATRIRRSDQAKVSEESDAWARHAAGANGFGEQ